MIANKKEFGIGVALIAVFFVALAVVFSPIFENGKNALDYLDGVFNSISKASAYYIPASIEKARKLEGTAVAVVIKVSDAEQARETEKLLAAAGATVRVDGAKLAVSGDLGKILGAALADADAMFKNDGASLSNRYGIEGKKALYAWHTALGDTMRDLNKQGKFKEASTVRDSMTKALEPAYNYFGITAISMKHMIGIALVALIGYVVYTIWYGFAILFLFEGWGLKLEH
jgi:hypothetical protein